MFEADPYEEQKSIYSGMKLGKKNTPDFEGVAVDSTNYEDKISQIKIPRARGKEKDDFSTEKEQSMVRSELGKLMWLARNARPDAIYDASAAARNFANFKPDVSNGEISEEETEEEKHIKKGCS